MDAKALLDEAFTAAEKAVNEAKNRYGSDRGMCGFGWAHFPSGRGPLASAMKADPRCSKDYRKGYVAWNPGRSNWQNVDVAAAGAHAFAAALKPHFPEIYATSRLD